MRVEARARELGLVLPEPFQSPTGRPYPFSWVRMRGTVPTSPGTCRWRRTARWRSRAARWARRSRPSRAMKPPAWRRLAAFGSLRRELGDLDRLSAWLRVFGMVNVAPGFSQVAGVGEWLLGVADRGVRPRGGRPCALRGGEGGAPVRRGGGDRGRSSDRRRRLNVRITGAHSHRGGGSRGSTPSASHSITPSPHHALAAPGSPGSATYGSRRCTGLLFALARRFSTSTNTEKPIAK